MLTMTRRLCLPGFMVMALGILLGCSTPPPDTEPVVEVSEEALPDFALPDVNANSARFQQSVSPRDYVGQVSAWYFGNST